MGSRISGILDVLNRFLFLFAHHTPDADSATEPPYERKSTLVSSKFPLEVMFLNAYNAFLAGYKPAYFCDHDKEHFDHLKKTGYPSVEVIKNRATLFFAKQSLKKQYLLDLNGAEIYSYQYYIAVGKALGYPPIAAKFFADCTFNPELERQGAVFQYAGRYFSGHIADVIPIVQWLWSNVVDFPVSPVKITYQDKEYQMFPPEQKVV